jgi:adenylate cyclase
MLAWAIAMGLYTLIRHVGAKSLIGWEPSTSTLVLMWGVASALFGACFYLVLLMAESRGFRSRPYGFLILAKAIAMLIAVLLVIFGRGVVAVAVGAMTPQQAWEENLKLLVYPEMAVFLVYVWLTTVVLGFVVQMAAMAGRRVLMNLLLGKYNRPKTETRIFMFLDLEGSTAIAERLGHEEFFRLIQECFRDLTDSAIRCNVEVYQYVGDEAILTWTPEKGIEDSNCIRVFFDYQQVFESRAQYYTEQFGVVPKFKAGANLGPVTVAELGIVKRDIAYLSDVLNTAARLESMCRQYDAGLLITESLRDVLPSGEEFQCEPIGAVELRGKADKIEAYRVTQRQQGR